MKVDPSIHTVGVPPAGVRRPGATRLRPHRGDPARVAAEFEPVVTLADVRKTYGSGENAVEALKGVDFEALPGKLTAIVGPSGSGKSTLLNLLGGLDVPTSGQIWFGDREVSTLTEKERTAFRAHNIGFVFQFLNLLPGLTCAQNVMLGGVIAGMAPRVAHDRAVELLGTVGLAQKAGKLARDLSGGQMQRVAIARALMNDAPLLLADEPTGNLDESNAEEITTLLRERATDGRAVVLVTHNNDLAERYADEVRTVRDGVILDGPDTAVTGQASGPSHAVPPVDELSTAAVTTFGAQTDETLAGQAEIEIGPVDDIAALLAVLQEVAHDGCDLRLRSVAGGRATFNIRPGDRTDAVAGIALRLGRDHGVRLREDPGGRTVIELERR